jgi:hypothetical protein
MPAHRSDQLTADDHAERAHLRHVQRRPAVQVALEPSLVAFPQPLPVPLGQLDQGHLAGLGHHLALAHARTVRPTFWNSLRSE